MLCLSGLTLSQEPQAQIQEAGSQSLRNMARGPGTEEHLMNLIPGKVRPLSPVPRKVLELCVIQKERTQR